jgi:hypothetical protein
MVTQEDRNWLDENDIFDKFIFDRLTGADRVRLQKLIADHSDVNAELELNLMIAAGLRQKGRWEMKRRLQDNLGSGRPYVFSLMSQTSLILKIAAAVVILLGSSFIIYKSFIQTPEPASVAQNELKNEDANKEVMTIPREEKADSEKSTQKLTAKKSVAKPLLEQRPVIAAAPTETIPTVRNQKFRVEASMIPKPNEIKIPLKLEAENKEIEGKLFFRNPIDLSAVNIKETQGEQNGQLTWFYVFYENRVLNIYLDNTTYLTYFKNASLTESLSALTLRTEQVSYVIDVTSKDKFKKAVLKP